MIKDRVNFTSFRSRQAETLARISAEILGRPATFLDQRRQRWVVEDPGQPPILDLKEKGADMVQRSDILLAVSKLDWLFLQIKNYKGAN